MQFYVEHIGHACLQWDARESGRHRSTQVHIQCSRVKSTQTNCALSPMPQEPVFNAHFIHANPQCSQEAPHRHTEVPRCTMHTGFHVCPVLGVASAEWMPV